jgi:hypothetical protein
VCLTRRLLCGYAQLRLDAIARLRYSGPMKKRHIGTLVFETIVLAFSLVRHDWQTFGMAMLWLGILGNTLAVGFNEWSMPVFVPVEKWNVVPPTGLHHLATPRTRCKWLCDHWIAVLGMAPSLGDVLLLLGAIVVVATAEFHLFGWLIEKGYLR